MENSHIWFVAAAYLAGILSIGGLTLSILLKARSTKARLDALLPEKASQE